MNISEYRNLTFDLIGHAERTPGNAALILADRIVSYADLNERVWAASRYLHGAGVRAGDIVALTCADQFRFALALLGLVRLGATPFPLLPSVTPAQRQDMFAASGVAFAIADMAEGFETAVTRVPFEEDNLDATGTRTDILCPAPEGPCLLVAGSGTTGKPRLIPITHPVMGARAALGRHVYSLQPQVRLMCASPLGFATAIALLFGAVSAGSTLCLYNQQGGLLDAILAMRPEALYISVLHAERILQEARKNPPVDLSGIRVLAVGGSTVSEDLRKRLREDVKANLVINYGTNEVSRICFATPADLDAAPGGVGRPLPGVQVEIVDDADQPVAPGQVGQVRVKSSAMIAGYFDGSDAERFRGGWFHPGDLARWAPDGQLIHLGRADQMMIMNGINIYPTEIERTLDTHPAVRETVAFPLKHPIHQDLPVCAVALHPGAVADPAGLAAFAAQRLGARAPRRVFVLPELPRNPQGKIIRAELNRLVEEQMRPQPVPAPAAPALPAAGQPGGPRQRLRRIDLRFTAPAELNLKTFHAWCAVLLPDWSPASAKGKEPVQLWLQGVLALARELLQVAGVPVFDLPQVLSCTRPAAKGGQWTASVTMPVLEQLHDKTYETALNVALRSAQQISNRPVTPENCQALFAALEKQGVEPLRKLNPFGKSTIHVLRAAHARGVPFSHLGAGIFQLGWGARARRVDRSTTARDSAIGLRLSQNKVTTAALLRRAGLPAPVHEAVPSLQAARAVAERIGWPVVVKPADRERGEGVTVDTGPEGLEAAFAVAHKLSPRKQVIVERQVEGTCHRLFIAGGRLLYAVKRLPMGVYGDGARSVAELVAAEVALQGARPGWQRSEIRPIDEMARSTLAAAGLTEASVPPAGRFVALRRIETTAWGGVDEEVTQTLHPENLRVALAAARLFGLDVAGIDIISPDITQPWHSNGAIINEVNYAPLLGGAEISRRYIPQYLDRLIEGDGRIPVEVYVGDDQAIRAAERRYKELAGQGIAVCVTTHRQTIGAGGQPLVLSAQGLYARTRALVLAPEVEVLLIVVQSDEFLETGLPLEAVDTVHTVNHAIQSVREQDGAARREHLMQLLAQWVRPRRINPAGGKGIAAPPGGAGAKLRPGLR